MCQGVCRVIGMGLSASKRRAFEFQDGCGCRELPVPVLPELPRLPLLNTKRSPGINSPLDSRIMAVLKEARSTQKAPESFEKILLQLPKVRGLMRRSSHHDRSFDRLLWRRSRQPLVS